MPPLVLRSSEPLCSIRTEEVLNWSPPQPSRLVDLEGHAPTGSTRTSPQLQRVETPAENSLI